MGDPRAEAFERVGGRFDVRVLEPAPPAVQAPPWYADDPIAAEPRRADLPLVSAVANGDLTWDELARREPDLQPWCAERWLGAWRALTPLADAAAIGLVTTRESWHALAERVLGPARRHACGKIGLRFTRGGFGTPYFARNEQIRVEGQDLVVTRDGNDARQPITTVTAAGAAAGIA